MPMEGSETPKMHYMIVDELLCGQDSVQAMVHREGAKTTVLSKFTTTGSFNWRIIWFCKCKKTIYTRCY